MSFAEAQTVFANPLAVLFDDEVHSALERREIIIGLSARNRLILVCFTEQGDIVRIIHARGATPKERRDYIAHVFKTSESVKTVLRALIAVMPDKPAN